MFFQFFRFYLFFWFAFIGCSEESSPPVISMVERNKVFYGYRTLSYNEKINSVAYNKKTQSIIFSIEPTGAKQTSVYEFPFKQIKNLNLEEFSNNFKLKTHAAKPNKLIKISSDGNYLAFASWNGELILKTKDSIHSKLKLENNITSLEFIDNFIAIGDKGGNISIYDIEKKKIHTSIKLFNGNVTSITLFKNSQFFASGVNSTLYQIDAITGEILNSFNARNSMEKLLNFSGINHCTVDQINKVLYIPEKEVLVTTHGWDYCSKPKIKIWDVNNLKLIFQSQILDEQVSAMVWTPNDQEIIFADSKPSFWTLNLNNYEVKKNIQFSNFIDLFQKKNGKNKIYSKNFKLGNVNSISLIPNTNIIIMGLGSYFKGGSALLITRKMKSGFNHQVVFAKGNGIVHIFTLIKTVPS
jgi:hypothetical protein